MGLLLVLLEEDEYSAVCCCGIRLGGIPPSLEEDDGCSPHMYNVDLDTLDFNDDVEEATAASRRCDDEIDEKMEY
jgi:hypothetical protein